MEHTAIVWESIPCQPLEWEEAGGDFPCLELEMPAAASDASSEEQAEVVSDRIVQTEAGRESFTHKIARWTQLEMESTFLREMERLYAFPLRVNTVVKLPQGRLSRVVEMLLPKLEAFVQHGYGLRAETAAALLKTLLITGQDERARILAEAMLGLTDEHSEIRYYQALAAFRLELFDEACEHAAAAIRLDGGNEKAFLLLAVAQRKAGNPIAAAETLAAALPLFSANESVLRFTLSLLRRTGRKAALFEVLTRLESLAAGDAEIVLLLADLFYERGHTSEACTRYENHQEGLDSVRQCHYGICLAELGREEEALRVLSSLLESGGPHEKLETVVADLYDSGNRDPGLLRLICNRFWAEGRFEECLDFCLKARDAEKTDAGLVLLTAECYTQLGRYDQAISLLEELPATGGAADEREYLLGQALYRIGRKSEAAPCLEAGLRLPSRQTAALRMLAEIATEMPDHARAAGLYRRLSRLLPSDVGVVAKAAWSSMRAGMTALAIEGFRDLVRLVPDCPEAWNNLGVLLARDAQYAEATKCFKTSLTLRPGQHEAKKNLALVYDRVLRTRSAEYLELCAEDELSALGRSDG